LVRSDHEAMRCVPDEYCRETVLPSKGHQHTALLGVVESSTVAGGLTNVGELAVLKDDKVELLREPYELVGERQREVVDDVAVCLRDEPKIDLPQPPTKQSSEDAIWR
jgi:hypothetical protein